MHNQAVKDFEDRIAALKTITVQNFGKSVIIAPHPDDETLGCGGTAALLLKHGIGVHFIFVSDGTMSHPNSKKYPADRLRNLRELEAENAVRALGGRKEDITFLALPDRKVPNRDNPYFESAVRIFVQILKHYKPDTLFIPWRNDPHPDHQACFRIVTEAVTRLGTKPVLLQYPIWLWEMGTGEDIELIRQMELVGVDITATLAVKQAALQAHESQTTNLIDDDEEGFRLSPEIISHFRHHKEIFFLTRAE